MPQTVTSIGARRPRRRRTRAACRSRVRLAGVTAPQQLASSSAFGNARPGTLARQLSSANSRRGRCSSAPSRTARCACGCSVSGPTTTGPPRRCSSERTRARSSAARKGPGMTASAPASKAAAALERRTATTMMTASGSVARSVATSASAAATIRAPCGCDPSARSICSRRRRSPPATRRSGTAAPLRATRPRAERCPVRRGRSARAYPCAPTGWDARRARTGAARRGVPASSSRRNRCRDDRA